MHEVVIWGGCSGHFYQGVSVEFQQFVANDTVENFKCKLGKEKEDLPRDTFMVWSVDSLDRELGNCHETGSDLMPR